MNAPFDAIGKSAAHRLIDELPHEEPADEYTAREAVNELGRILTERKFFAKLIARSLRAAQQLASDPLQGLTEIFQNADDAQATITSLAFRRTETGCDLLVAHDGRRAVVLADVLAMSAPWVSNKFTDSEAAGRFGIGFKIVHAFSSEVHVHAGPYHFEANGTRLHTVPAEPAIPGFYDPASGATLIRLRLKPQIEVDRIISWLREQPDTNLLFLASLRKIGLVDLDGTVEPFERALKFGRSRPSFEYSPGEGRVKVTHTVPKTSDGRKWYRFDAVLPVPSGLERAEKSTGAHTRVSLALPREAAPQPIYVTFPTKIASTLPFALDAQFDPVVSRESLQDTEWNRWLVSKLGELVTVVARHLLATAPELAWGAVPLASEGVTCSQGAWLMHHLTEVLSNIRKELIASAGLLVNGQLVPLDCIAYEEPELSSILETGEMARIRAGLRGVPPSIRDPAGRWRSVMAELEKPVEVGLPDVVGSLAASDNFDHKPPAWYVEVLARAADDHRVSQEDIRDARLVIDRMGKRHRAEPRSRAGVVMVMGAEADPFARTHGLVIELADAFAGSAPHAARAREWLSSHSTLVPKVEPADILSAYANAYSHAPRKIEPDEFRVLRDLFETVPEDAAADLGPRVGAAVLLKGRKYAANGANIPVEVTAVGAYLPQRYEREVLGWAMAADRTPSLVWVDTEYEDHLKAKGRKARGESRARGARAFLGLLGVLAMPRVFFTDVPETASTRPSWAPAHGLQIFENYVSPDLAAVIADIASDSANGAARAAALYRCIARNWDRALKAKLWAKAGRRGRNSFNLRLKVPAAWLATLIDRTWLRDELGKPAQAKSLIIRCPRSEAIYGTSARYAAELGEDDLKSPLATALGIEQRAPASRLVQQLEGMRSGAEELDPARIMRCYLALAEQCPPPSTANILEREVGDIRVNTLRGKFGMKTTGRGLLYDAEANAWRAPSAFYRGPDIFRGRRPRVPNALHLLPLWITLGIREPTIEDCRKEIEAAANASPTPGAELDTFLVNIYRHIQAKVVEERVRPGALAHLPLVCGDRWVAERPVYVVEGFETSSELLGRAGELRIWTPPCDTHSVRGLMQYLRVVEARPEVTVSGHDWVDPEDEVARLRFRSAVIALQDDVARNDLAVYEAIPDWAKLRDAEVRVHGSGCLRLTLDYQSFIAGKVSIGARAYGDVRAGCIHVETEEDLAGCDQGGRAVAAFFAPEVRPAVALRWMAAWSRSEGCSRASIELARDADDSAHVHALAEMISEGLKKRPSPPKAGGNVKDSRRAKGDQQPEPPQIEERFQRLRDFDPSTALIVVGVEEASVPPGPRPSGKAALVDGAGGVGRGGKQVVVRKQYNDHDVETLALRIVIHLLSHTSDKQIQDIRQRRSSGADATIDWQQFIEIKSFYGPAPSSVDLTPHQCERARACGRDFILAVASGLGDDQELEVRLIADPLGSAAWEARRGITIKQVDKARAIVIRDPTDAA